MSDDANSAAVPETDLNTIVDTEIQETNNIPPVNDISETTEPVINTPPDIPIVTVTKKVIVDNKGLPFDPKIHETNPDGTARVTSNGFCRLKRGNKGIKNISSQSPQTQTTSETSPIENESGKMAAELWEANGVMVFGEDWRATPEEKSVLTETFALYLKSKNIKDIPAGWLLAIILTHYTVKRMAKPTIREKIVFAVKVIWNKIKGLGKKK